MYNKLFSKIVLSSIWLEPLPTRVVWIAFLATMDEDGFVQCSAMGNVASLANVTIDEAKNAIKTLESPDSESGNPEHEGRRIERVPGGWMVLNANVHRDIITREMAKEKTRLRVQRHRAKRNCNGGVTVCNDFVTPSVSVSVSDTEKEKVEKEKTPTDKWLIPKAWDSPELRTALDGFAAMRKSIKKPIRSKSRMSAGFKNFDDAAHLIFAVEFCTTNDYSGLKPEYRPEKKPKSRVANVEELKHTYRPTGMFDE